MTTKEIKTLLYNIFNLKFKYNSNNCVYYVGSDVDNSVIAVYYNKYDRPIDTSWIDIYSINNLYHGNMINILNNKPEYGFISYTSDNYINFVFYDKFKNIDI